MSEEIAMSAYKKAKTADVKADANAANIASFAQQTAVLFHLQTERLFAIIWLRSLL